MKSKLQEIASFAYDCVMEVKNKSFEKDYLSHARKLPSMIVHNGLLTTCAFIRSKQNDDGWKKIEEHIKRYMKEIENKEVDSLVKFFSGLDLKEYRLYTRKVLYFAQWLKRVAEGELKYEEQAE
ncbi:type III-B CRISPR module-associated protein Cmr5 [Hydrogenobacter sp. T-2]|uniref:type III-B CRISPR module-associated protein Cmr5 n=1 Tax=Pampinifervens diazotrophicum TaxID=1632018 RepID=UPI002B25E0F8|nr:type III-B CRISPR module-associated protein Cmr5 [Hydrogenobacter sp. T-2]WPM32648.1 type III-B CRISPR module-associated protein Cmr5 [Hydrogenobacter sp. T-2]